MKKIYILTLIFAFLWIFSSMTFASSSFENILSDYPEMGKIERSIILEELKSAVKYKVDEYDLESILTLATKRHISPLGLKDIISLINQAAKLNLYPDLLVNKAKEGLLKRVREDLIIEALRNRLEYLRAANLIIDSLGDKLHKGDKRELIFIIVQNLENGLSEDMITELLNYSFGRKADLDYVRTLLDEISTLSALDIDEEAVLNIGKFFLKKKTSDTNMKEVIDVILLAVKIGVPKDRLSEFLRGAYRYKNSISLRNAILRFIREYSKNKKIKKVTPTTSLPPPPKK